MYFGFNNDTDKLMLGGKILNEVDVEKDLGVLIQNNLKVDKQCNKAANEANKILGMIRRSFVYRDANIILPLYKSLVRPHLDYCIQVYRKRASCPRQYVLWMDCPRIFRALVDQSSP